ncbi:MAG TPA: hypothetical protein VFZ61_21980, partial [Polyangiales bacterium]
MRKIAGVSPAHSGGVVGPSMRRARLALLWLLAFVACAGGFEVAQACADDAATQAHVAVGRGIDPTPLAKAAPEVRYYQVCDEAPPESALEGVDSEDSQHDDGLALRTVAAPAGIVPMARFVRPVVRRSAT